MQADAPPAEKAQELIRPLPVLTTEHILFAAVGFVAAILRLGGLDRVPFSPAEAETAWQVWGWWQPVIDPPLFAPVSPAYFSLAALFSQVLGFSDAAMRLLPALAGLAAVGLIWLWRPFLGRSGSLAAAALLAVSPVLVAGSRTVGGESLAVLALITLASGWLRIRTAPEAEEAGRWWTVCALALGLGLASAPLFYGGLAAVLLAILLSVRLGPQLGFARPAPWKRLALPFGAVFLGSATLFLWHLPGLGLAANLPAQWLAAFGGGAESGPWLDPLLALLRYEFPVVVPGLVIAFWLTWRGDPLGSWLTYWLMGGLLLLLVQAGSLDNVLLVAVPAYLLIGLGLERLYALVGARGGGFLVGAGQLAGLLLILAAITATNIGRYARQSLFNPADGAHLVLALLCLLIALAVWTMVSYWEPPVGVLGGLLTLLVLILVVNWGSAWRLATWAGNDTRERWVQTAADVELPLLVQTLDEAARELRGTAAAATVFIAPAGAEQEALLRWYLRDFDRATWGEVVMPDETADFVLAPAAAEPAFGADYLGSDFGLVRRDAPNNLDLLPALRWWLFGQSDHNMPVEAATLWVRADLVNGQ